MADLSEAAVQELKAKYPGIDLHAVKVQGDTWVLRTPSAESWDAFQSEIFRDKDRVSALRNYVLDNIVHPKRDEVAAAFSKRPALPTTLSAKLTDLAGASDELDVKKL